MTDDFRLCVVRWRGDDVTWPACVIIVRRSTQQRRRRRRQVNALYTVSLKLITTKTVIFQNIVIILLCSFIQLFSTFSAILLLSTTYHEDELKCVFWVKINYVITVSCRHWQKISVSWKYYTQSSAQPMIVVLLQETFKMTDRQTTISIKLSRQTDICFHASSLLQHCRRAWSWSSLRCCCCPVSFVNYCQTSALLPIAVYQPSKTLLAF